MLNHDHEPTSKADTPGHQERTCIRCGAAFAYSNAEAAFRAEHRLSAPLTCPECRARDRASRNTEIIAIYEKAEAANMTADSVAVQRGGRGQVRGQLYTTTCDACGAETRVPFVPRGDRPVYCRDCYNARRGR